MIFDEYVKHTLDISSSDRRRQVFCSQARLSKFEHTIRRASLEFLAPVRDGSQCQNDSRFMSVLKTSEIKGGFVPDNFVQPSRSLGCHMTRT